MKEITEKQAWIIVDELELKIFGSFTDPDGMIWFNLEGPRIETSYGKDGKEYILVKSTRKTVNDNWETKYFMY